MDLSELLTQSRGLPAYGYTTFSDTAQEIDCWLVYLTDILIMCNPNVLLLWAHVCQHVGRPEGGNPPVESWFITPSKYTYTHHKAAKAASEL